MNSNTMMLAMLISHYQEMCPIVSMQELPDHTLRIRLDCHKDFEYVTLPGGERVKRGQQFGSKLKELLSHQTQRPIVVQYRTVSNIPTPEEYADLMGMDYDTKMTFIRVLSNSRRQARE